MSEQLEPVKHTIERFEPCESCNHPSSGHLTIYKIQTNSEIKPEDVLCEDCLPYYGYTQHKGEVFLQ